MDLIRWTRRRYWLWAGAAAVLLANAGAASAAVVTLGSYSFTNGSAASGDSEPLTTAAAATFGAFTKFTGGPTGAGVPAFKGSPANQVQVSGLATGSGTTTVADAIADKSYLEFQLQTNGYATSLSHLTFAHGFSGLAGGNSGSVAVTLSRTASPTSADVVASFTFSNPTGSSDISPTASRDIDLSALAAFQNNSSDVFVRFYFYDTQNQSGRYATIDDVTLTGTVPEPATAAMLAAAGLLLKRRRVNR